MTFYAVKDQVWILDQDELQGRVPLGPDTLRALYPQFVAWMQADKWQGEAGPEVAAAAALALEGAGGAVSPLAAPLSAALAKALPGLRQAAGLDNRPDKGPAEAKEGGMLAATAGALAYLRRLGPAGAELASKAEEVARKRWAEFLTAREEAEDPAPLGNDPERLRRMVDRAGLVEADSATPLGSAVFDLEHEEATVRKYATLRAAAALWRFFVPADASKVAPAARLLARALLPEVQAKAEKELARWGPAAALPRGFCLALESGLAYGPQLAPGPRRKSPPDKVAFKDPLRLDAPEGAISCPQVDGSLLRPGVLQALDTVAAARLPAFLAWQVYTRALAGDPRPGRLAFSGGLQALAQAMRLNSCEGDSLRSAIEALGAIKIHWPNGAEAGGLLHWQLTGAAPGRPARLLLELPDLWLPGYAARMKTHGSAVEDRLLVYLSEPHRRWGEVHPRRRPGQERLALAIHRYFAERSRELAEQGGLRLADPVWADLAEQARVRTRDGALAALRASFVAPQQPDLWPCLEDLPSGLVRLADPKVHAALVAQGELREKRAMDAKKPRRRKRKVGKGAKGG